MVTKSQSVRTIPYNKEVTIKGNVIRVEKGLISVCDLNGAETVVVMTKSPRITTHRRGILRPAAVRDESYLLLGLNVKVHGRGNQNGELVAKWIRFHDSDFRAMTEVDTRAIPIEAEQNRMAGQLDETMMVASNARKEAFAAQESAELARHQATVADNKAVAAHTRITALDDFESRDSFTITFKLASAVLTAEARAALDAFAARAINTRGYLIEISGFADASGGAEYNHVLSQRRAEAVMDYLVGTAGIPIRRIAIPYSAGEMYPVADNATIDGRAQNRRVEVKMLVSKGLATQEGVAQSKE
jgi:outer membrane protein OmpA-like peptidoglycan-associated protein